MALVWRHTPYRPDANHGADGVAMVNNVQFTYSLRW